MSLFFKKREQERKKEVIIAKRNAFKQADNMKKTLADLNQFFDKNVVVIKVQQKVK